MTDTGQCLFCRIVSGDLNAEIVHEDPLAVAFRDINPQAPVHALVVPRKHVASLNDLLPEDEPMVGHLVTVARTVAASLGVAESGYRTVFNCGAQAGQSVAHIHLHILGGRSLSWPPG